MATLTEVKNGVRIEKDFLGEKKYQTMHTMAYKQCVQLKTSQLQDTKSMKV